MSQDDILEDDVVMLTTIDNPYDPFTEFDEWNAYDIQAGYNTCGYVARIARTSPELSEADETIAINQAIDEIVKLNVLGIYKKVCLKSNSKA